MDHFKLNRRDGVFGWKFIKDFPSSHIHKWKRFGPGLFWCITVFFFKLFNVCLCNVLVPCYYFFSTSVPLFWSTESVDSVGTTIFTLPKVISSFIFIGTNSMFACFQMNVNSTFFLFFFFFFFNFHMVFFSPQTCVDSVGATIFTFPVVIQLNVFIAVPNHFVFWKIKIFFLQVST